LRSATDRVLYGRVDMCPLTKFEAELQSLDEAEVEARTTSDYCTRENEMK